MVAAVARFPRRATTRQIVRLRARLGRRRLDAALAAGADPWSASELMLRAARLSSFSGRLEIAAALETLVSFAEHNQAALPSSQPRPLAPCLRIRSGVVLEQRDRLLELAARLREPEPVGVAVVATLAWLVRDESSPVFAGGSPPGGVAEAAARCERGVRRATERF
jgi:hypothetical protein